MLFSDYKSVSTPLGELVPKVNVNYYSIIIYDTLF